MPKTYLYIGRFQPFHNEHLSCIKKMIKDGKIIIAIGSAQESWTNKNPFTASERYEMIWETMIREGLTAYVTILPIVDIRENHLWVANIQNTVPHFDAVYSFNPLSRGLFADAGYPIEPNMDEERSWLSATNVRDMITHLNQKWKDNVPEPVAEYIEKRGLDKRLRIIYKDE